MISYTITEDREKYERVSTTFVMRRSGVRLSSVAQKETIRFIDKKASNFGGFLVYIELKRFEQNIV